MAKPHNTRFHRIWRVAALSLTFGFILMGSLPRPAHAQTFQQPAPPPPGVSCSPDMPCTVGPYQVQFSYDRETYNTVDAVMVTVVRLGSQTDAWNLAAEILPDKTISATPVTFSGDFASGTAKVRQIKVNYPIAGLWYLHLTVSGAAGKGDLHSAVFVEPPPKMENWVAWGIGLSPILGIIGFAYGQWRLVQKRKRAELDAATADPLTPSTVG